MKNTIVKPPFQNRLVCSNCGCMTSYEPNGLNLAAMKVGGVCIAFVILVSYSSTPRGPSWPSRLEASR